MEPTPRKTIICTPCGPWLETVPSKFMADLLLRSLTFSRIDCGDVDAKSPQSDPLKDRTALMQISSSTPQVTRRGTPPAASSPEKTISIESTLRYSAGQALRGGLAGASAQVINVFCLMWMRTTMNYEYRYGGGTLNTISKLYKEGGVPRFYRGLVPALMQSPLSRFGDTAANVGMLALLDSSSSTQSLPIGVKTALASAGASLWRLVLMPLDAWKTIKQVEGQSGLELLRQKVRLHGVTKLYHGSAAAISGTFVGHYPWFFTHNYLSEKAPAFDFYAGKYVRNAMIGFFASVVSDTCSNSIRVVKTTRQTSTVPMSYMTCIKQTVEKDGIAGLLGRGLKTRILTNGMQGIVFSVGWKTLEEAFNSR